VATPIEPPPFRWGAQPRDWTTYQETGVRPLYEAVFDRLGLTAGTCLLDVGCGAGLDAASISVAFAAFFISSSVR
jgi:hypothetical protein